MALRFALHGNAKVDSAVVRGNLTLSHGLDALGATRRGEPMSSRDDAGGRFTHLVGWADWTRPLGDGFSVRVAAQGQISSAPLLVAEEIGIGGNTFLRGYDYSEYSGDQGYMSMAELRYDWNRPLGWSRKVQLYGYVDGGRVTNLRGGFGGGNLASGGGGLRFDVSPSVDANLEAGVPLSEARYETGNHQPRFTFRILKVF
jgi:hemolysin activation/secretion protein